MAPPNANDLDPSLLLTLHVLLEERHVTRAAQRLGLTQSTMSHRLQRLRKQLGDPLFVRARGTLLATPRAQEIRAPLGAALEALRAAVGREQPFEPATSPWRLSLAMPDLLAPLLPFLLTTLAAEAPNITVQALHTPSALAEALASGTPCMALGAVRQFDSGLVTRRLGSLRFGVIARHGHPALRGGLTVERWLSHPHVVVRTGSASPNLVGELLERKRLKRRIGVEVPTFLAGLLVLAETDLLLNAPLLLNREVIRRLGLVVSESPVPLPELPSALAWHPRFQADPAHRWTREFLVAAIRKHLERGAV